MSQVVIDPSLDKLKRKLKELHSELEKVTKQLDDSLAYFFAKIEPLKIQIGYCLEEQVLHLYDQYKKKNPVKKELFAKLKLLPEFLPLRFVSPSLSEVFKKLQGIDCQSLVKSAFEEFKGSLKDQGYEFDPDEISSPEDLARVFQSSRIKKEKSNKIPEIDVLYRQLVKKLHPDLEKDPAKREEKLSLMQKLNQAYESNDLPLLITLEKEMGSFTADLLPSKEILQKKIKDLESEIEKVPHSIKYAALHSYISLPFFNGVSTMQEIYNDLCLELTRLKKEEL